MPSRDRLLWMARLILHETGQGMRQVVVERDVFRVGRGIDNDLPLDADGVSAFHAELTRDSRGYSLIPLEDSGETLVNGQPSGPTPLRSGDEIRLGSARLTFEYDEIDAPSPSLAGERPPAWRPVSAASADSGEHRVPVEELAEEHRQGSLGTTDARDERRFALLYGAGKQVLSAATLDEVTDLVLPLVFDCLSAERGALLLEDPESGEMRPRVLRHRDGRELSEAELRVPSSIVEAVVKGRLGILTLDALHDERFEGRDSIQGGQIRSALCAPLWDENEILGVIYLDSRIETQAFARPDLVLLNAIANLIAIRLRQDALFEQLADERVLRTTLARFHSPDVVEAILSRSGERGDPGLGLEEQDVSVFFADLKGWTSMAEVISPAVIAEILNEYYALATRIVFANGGSVNEYIGDSVMAIFGAPVKHPDHADRAVRTALQLLSELSTQRQGLLAEFGSQVRVAINSGRAVVGTLGSAERLKYAVIGDTVNVAARLEHVGPPNTLTIGEETYRRLSDTRSFEDLGLVKLRGREKPVRTYRAQGGGSCESVSSTS